MFGKMTLGEKIFNIFNVLFLGFLAFAALFPFVNVIATSLSSGRAILSGGISLWPVEFNTDSYKSVMRDGQLFVAFKNSLMITVVGTTLNMLATIITAYPLSKRRFRGRKQILMLITFTMLFSGGMIPNFILIKQLGLMNTYMALWLPGLIGTFNMFVLKSFFEGIPENLEEAAIIDGANDIYILIKIILPVSRPVIATLILFYAVGWWNSYMSVMMYISDANKWSITVRLIQMIQNTSQRMLNPGEGISAQASLVAEGVRAASIVIATFPILCIYPFLQKHFIKGIMIGSLKG